jgi:hypothetical protein
MPGNASAYEAQGKGWTKPIRSSHSPIVQLNGSGFDFVNEDMRLNQV